MEIRKYRQTDCEQMYKLFYDTVHNVNSKDYTPEQIDAWADGKADLKKWDESFLSHFTVVAVSDGIIVGFGDIDKTGYLDRLYVHKDYQRRAIASAICDVLESSINGTITTHASITALPFFKSRGYEIIQAQQVERHGVLLTNYIMKKGCGKA